MSVRATALLLVTLFLPTGFLATSASADHVGETEVRWACGYGRRDPSGCGIDAIMDPEFTSRSWIDPEDTVIGVVVGNDARAYPVRMLDQHEIVNDDVGGKRLAITWCPLCGSAIVFERIVAVDGKTRTLTFDVSGYLYKHDLVMWDKETHSLWTQIKGTPIGTLEDATVSTAHPEATLTIHPSELTTWRDWRERYGHVRLLSNQGRSYGGAYIGYDKDCNIGVYGGKHCDVGGLHPKEQVIGVVQDGHAVAYPVFGLESEGGVVHDQAEGRSLVVVAEPRSAIVVYDGNGHRFVQNGEAWIDEAGRLWDLRSGRALDGTATLEPVDHVVLFWFAWREHNPDTALWLPTTSEGQMPRSEPGLIPAPSAGVVLVALAGFLLIARRRRTA